MKILIAPDKFKGSMTANEVCETIIKGLKKHVHSHEIIAHPLADGGDGSIDILANYLPLSIVNCSTTDPLGRKIPAHYYLSEKTAFIELAVASGLTLLAPKEQNPMNTSTIGTGELIKDAIEKGAKSIYLFVGGSATNDGGMGLSHALGYRFLDKKGLVLLPIGKNLSQVNQIDDSLVQIDFTKVRITLLNDVSNPLLGRNGAAYTYAPQKGASPQEIRLLDQGMKHFSTFLCKQYGLHTANLNGAAGGVSACLVGLLNAQTQSGVKKIMEWTCFEQQLLKADLVISGEGQLDAQSLSGKVVGEVAKLAQKNNKPLLLLVGSYALTSTELQAIHAKKIISIMDVAKSLDDAVENGAVYLEQLAGGIYLSKFE